MARDESLMHYSTADCFERCPYRYKLRYVDRLETVDAVEADNALRIGTAMHRGIETDVETAVREYLMSYPIVTDRHVEEAMKLRYLIPLVKDALPPDGIHELQIQSTWYQGAIDYLVPCTKLDADLPNGRFDMYDFKYSNNVDSYMGSKQLHVYKHFCERITGKRVRNLYFVFIPKVRIRQKKTETLDEFRRRILAELEANHEVSIRKVEFDQGKVFEFYETCESIHYAKDFPKNESWLCRWCEYEDFCQKGDNTMILPSSERRDISKVTKRKLWIYGGAFSGKTTFVDAAPNPINLNTDGNVQFVTMPYIGIKDTFEGRKRMLAWQVFKDAIEELDKTAGENGFDTVVVDLLEDCYESCRLYMYDKLGITHESDDSFKAWDKVRTEFLSTVRKVVNLDYENVILISHEDMSKDITKRTGDKITSIKPPLPEKVNNKVAGMVDIVARVVVEDDDTRTLNFKSSEVVFGGGRLKGIKQTSIPLDWKALCEVYDEANRGRSEKVEQVETRENEKAEEVEQVEEVVAEVIEQPRARRTRRTRGAE